MFSVAFDARRVGIHRRTRGHVGHERLAPHHCLPLGVGRPQDPIRGHGACALERDISRAGQRCVVPMEVRAQHGEVDTRGASVLVGKCVILTSLRMKTRYTKRKCRES